MAWGQRVPPPLRRLPGPQEKSRAGVGAESTAQMHFLSSQLGSPFGLVYVSGTCVSSYRSVLDTRHQCFHIPALNREARGGEGAEVKESAEQGADVAERDQS